jgi:hypothetical protein
MPNTSLKVLHVKTMIFWLIAFLLFILFFYIGLGTDRAGLLVFITIYLISWNCIYLTLLTFYFELEIKEFKDTNKLRCILYSFLFIVVGAIPLSTPALLLFFPFENLLMLFYFKQPYW